MPAEPFVARRLDGYPHRVLVVDGFIGPETCRRLREYLESRLARKGHTNVNRQFSNTLVTIEEVDDPEIRSLVLDISMRKQTLIAREFPECVPLHRDSTHLVRWTPEHNPGLGYHADNQFWDQPESEHYSAQRDLSSVLYLNDDFDGGQFEFREPTVAVEPRPGRLVAFGAGLKYVHRVRPVTRGRRYTMPSWWTYGQRPEAPLVWRRDPIDGGGGGRDPDAARSAEK